MRSRLTSDKQIKGLGRYIGSNGQEVVMGLVSSVLRKMVWIWFAQSMSMIS